MDPATAGPILKDAQYYGWWAFVLGVWTLLEGVQILLLWLIYRKL